jgi:hypothetical protein
MFFQGTEDSSWVFIEEALDLLVHTTDPKHDLFIIATSGHNVALAMDSFGALSTLRT